MPPFSNDRVFLDVVATNKDNYETGLLKLIVNVIPKSSSESVNSYRRSVRLKIDNMNLVKTLNTLS